ncbi:MAG: hypothetical protein NT142_17735 [Planctomycetota bacterium]|nr:hypothetical protein [Planctomycetota bacterium]
MVGIFLLVSVSMAPLQGPDEKINHQKWEVAIAAMKPRQEKFTSAKFLRREEKKEYFNLIEGGDEPVWISSNTVKSNKIIDCYSFTDEKIVGKSKNASVNYGIIINDKYCFEIAKKQESPGLSQDWRIPPPPIWTQRMSVFPSPIVDHPSRKPESMEVFRGCLTPIFQLPIRRPTPIVLS